MQRRDFVKAMVAASLSARAMVAQQAGNQVAPATPPEAPLHATPAPPPPGPVPWMRGLEDLKPLSLAPISPDMVAETDTGFFSLQEMATLRRLCDALLPRYQQYPSAADAGAPEFLDFLIGASPSDVQQMYRSGLERLEAEASQHFGRDFSSLDENQADTLIRPSLRTWMTDHPPTEPFARFINLAHADIRTATINSRPWSEAEGKESSQDGLFWFPVDPDLRRNMAAAAGATPIV